MKGFIQSRETARHDRRRPDGVQFSDVRPLRGLPVAPGSANLKFGSPSRPAYPTPSIYEVRLLTWLDRGAAVSLGIVLVRRVGFIPAGATSALLWATCDILYGNLSRATLHTCGQRRHARST